MDNTSWPRRIRSFLLIYIACAVMFQLGGATPDWGPQSSLEAFSAGLFGMLAWMALVLAKRKHAASRAFWIASFVALVILGLDEFFEIHESIQLGTGSESDHLKVGLWLGAAGALALVHWLERPSRGAQMAMAMGYAAHTLYLVAEVGDGGYFHMPGVSAATTALAEDVFELLMLSMYLFAFSAIDSESAQSDTEEEEEPRLTDGSRAA